MISHQNLSILILTLLVCSSQNSNAQLLVDEALSYGLTEIITSPELGSGLSTIDFNQDGLDDVTMTTNFGDIICYLNTGNGFELQDFGLTVPFMATSTIWVDYDNDNDLDILISGFLSPLLLYRNDGDFNFQEVGYEVGLSQISANYYGCSFADYDLDGDLDLYTTIYAPGTEIPFHPDRINRLYNNIGNGTFADVTISSQILAPASHSFQANWFDYNLDGWPDLFVINDRTPSNYLFLNNGNGTFSEVAEDANLGYPFQDCMTNSVCDYDHDGDMDLFMTNTGGPSNDNVNMFATNFNGLYSVDQTEEYGLDDSVPGWGGVWFDANNDTSEDLLYVTENDYPIFYYKNNDGLSFTPANELISVDANHPSYCPAKGDFNDDGYADIAIQCKAPNPSYLLMNQGGSNNFLKITLQGFVSNSKAIGSWVKVYKNGTTYSQYTHCGENYLGQNSQHLIFGMGNFQTADSLEVIYPNWHKDTYYDVAVNQHLYVYEGETYTVEIASNLENSLCEGDSIQLDAGMHDSYYWSNGAQSQSIWVSSSDEYSVMVQNQFGLTAVDTIQVTFNPNPLISAQATFPLCSGDSTGAILLTNLNGIALDSIVWSTGEVSDTLQNIPAGDYSYTYYDINGCSTSGTIPVLEPSAMAFFTTSTPEFDGNENGSISILIFGGTPSYQVYLDTILVSNEIDSLAAGEYTFTIIDSNMCTDTITILVDLVTDVDDIEAIKIDLYPNPVSDELTVQSEQKIEEISVFNISGILVKRFNQNQNNHYSFADLPNGTYIVRIRLQNKSAAVYRIVKI